MEGSRSVESYRFRAKISGEGMSTPPLILPPPQSYWTTAIERPGYSWHIKGPAGKVRGFNYHLVASDAY